MLICLSKSKLHAQIMLICLERAKFSKFSKECKSVLNDLSILFHVTSKEKKKKKKKKEDKKKKRKKKKK